MLLVTGRESGTSIVVCKGNFPARKSACDSIDPKLKDLVPSEIMQCTSPASASQMASLLLKGGSDGWVSLDFSTEGALSRSLDYMPVLAAPLYVSYGDCNSARSLPELDENKRYVAVVLLNNEAARGSLALNAATHDTATRLELESEIKFYDTNLLASEDFRSQLADQFVKCQGKQDYCALQFNSLVISKEANIVMNSYL